MIRVSAACFKGLGDGSTSMIESRGHNTWVKRFKQEGEKLGRRGNREGGLKK